MNRFLALCIFVLVLGAVWTPIVFAQSDDVAQVKAAEMAFNAAQNAGNMEALFSYLAPGRTIFANGGRLGVGWTEQNKKRRQAQFDAGRKVDLQVEDLQVRIFGDTAVTTFYRRGTEKEVNEPAKPVHLQISGVWVRTPGGWKLAHRHESPATF